MTVSLSAGAKMRAWPNPARRRRRARTQGQAVRREAPPRTRSASSTEGLEVVGCAAGKASRVSSGEGTASNADNRCPGTRRGRSGRAALRWGNCFQCRWDKYLEFHGGQHVPAGVDLEFPLRAPPLWEFQVGGRAESPSRCHAECPIRDHSVRLACARCLPGERV